MKSHVYDPQAAFVLLLGVSLVLLHCKGKDSSGKKAEPPSDNTKKTETSANTPAGNLVGSCNISKDANLSMWLEYHDVPSTTLQDIIGDCSGGPQDSSIRWSTSACPGSGQVGSCTLTAAENKTFGVAVVNYYYNPVQTAATAKSSCDILKGAFK